MRSKTMVLAACAAGILTLGTGSAAADPITDVAQQVGDSTGAVQVGDPAVSAPVRVLSDGGDAAAPAPAESASADAGQQAGGSTGAVQVGDVAVNAPVRVASDGGGEAAPAAAEPAPAATGDGGQSGAGQQAGGSTGAAQVGSPAVSAPVRVLSDGGDAAAPAPAATADGGQNAGESTGAVQVGDPALSAPVRVLSADGDAPTAAASDDGGDPAPLPVLPATVADTVNSVAGGGVVPDRGDAGDDGTGNASGVRPVADNLPGDPGAGGVSPDHGAGDVSPADALGALSPGEELPFTGLGLVRVALAGLAALTAGAIARAAAAHTAARSL